MIIPAFDFTYEKEGKVFDIEVLEDIGTNENVLRISLCSKENDVVYEENFPSGKTEDQLEKYAIGIINKKL